MDAAKGSSQTVSLGGQGTSGSVKVDIPAGKLFTLASSASVWNGIQAASMDYLK